MGLLQLAKELEPKKQSEKDSEYIKEHSVIKYLRGKLACYLHWFSHSLKLPAPNGRHDQLYEHQIRRLMRRVLQRSDPQGGGRGRERPEIQVFSRLDIGNKDFLGEQFVNCRWSRGATTRMCRWTLSIPRPCSTRGPLPISSPPRHVLVRAGGAPVPFPGEDRHERTIRVGLCSWTATVP